MNRDDLRQRDDLKQSARVFGDLLYRYTTLHRPQRMVVHQAEEDGWYMTVANLSGTLDIDIFLDRMINRKVRGYWVGFACDSEGEIRNLAMSSGLTIGGKFNDDDPTPPNNRQFPIQEHWSDSSAYFGIYSEPGIRFELDRALGFVCDVLRTVPGFEDSVRLGDTGVDIAAIEYDRWLDWTTKKQLIDARIGQGAYRRDLEDLWDGKCAVLGVINRRVLRASHVKPWKFSNNQERLDPHNGLLLTAHLDALFDAALITFSPSGEVIMANDLSESDRGLLRLGSGLRREPSPELRLYLEHHRGMFEARWQSRTTNHH